MSTSRVRTCVRGEHTRMPRRTTRSARDSSSPRPGEEGRDALHDAHFRRLWLAGLCVNVGRWLDFLVLGWLVLDLTGSRIWIEDAGARIKADDIASGPRVGIAYAEEDALKPWRFWLKDSAFVSRK